MKETTMKRKFFFITAAFLLTLNLTAFMAPSFAKKPIIPPGGGDPGLTCKWSTEICPDESRREVCLVDGNGRECTCGDVTRSCK
jgi:hypothetical protein